ncbi:prestin-like [Portunus trituberculatus]|uniref:prestin-like n=1 Tax=Portunus trituberculatus TaxID=210409 RepID=UPI001E1CF9DD|nr:prestin-like [Portunus trituberculatus]
MPVNGAATGFDCLKVVQVTRPALTVACRSSLYGHCPAHPPGSPKAEVHLALCLYQLGDLRSALQCSHTEAVAASGLRERVERQTRLCSKCSRDHLWSAVRGRLSILGWLLEYRVCHALLGDVITGVTVGIMHIPQGLGYAMLAGLPPITGLYMAFFPALVYVLMGTSRHVSIGTFAVSCMMMEKLVLELSTGDSTPTTTPGPPGENGTLVLVPDGSLHSVATSLNATAVSAVVVSHSSQEVAAVLALAVGMWQVLMGVLQVGQVFSVLLSHMITSTFTTSVAFLVLTSQLKNVLGIPVPRHSGPFKTIYTYRDLCLGLPSVNPVVVGVSVVCIVTLVANNELLKVSVSLAPPKKSERIPVPMELLVVVAGTAVSHLLHLEERHHVTVIGQVPTGLPPPSAPRLELLSAVLVDGFLIALISYTSTFSIAKIFAQRQGYTVDAAQELYAQGLLLQVKDLTKLWSSSRLDTAIWLATFVVSLVVGLDYGLLAGLVASAVVLLLRAQRPLALHLGHVPFTDLYLDLKTYHKAVEVPGVKIFQFGSTSATPLTSIPASSLSLAWTSPPTSLPTPITSVVQSLRREHGVHGDTSSQDNNDGNLVSQDKVSDGVSQASTQDDAKDSSSSQPPSSRDLSLVTVDSQAEKSFTCFISAVCRWLVLDLSLVSFVDTTGASMLKQLHHNLQTTGVTLCLASASDRVVDALERCGVLEEISRDLVFHSTHDVITTITCPRHFPTTLPDL